jgi:hypothetical protein
VGALLAGEIEQTPVTLVPCVEPRNADVFQHMIIERQQRATLTPDVEDPHEAPYERRCCARDPEVQASSHDQSLEKTAANDVTNQVKPTVVVTAGLFLVCSFLFKACRIQPSRQHPRYSSPLAVDASP